MKKKAKKPVKTTGTAYGVKAPKKPAKKAKKMSAYKKLATKGGY